MHVLTIHDRQPANVHAGDAAFNRLFRHFYSPLVLFARRMVQDKQVAEDIVADVFLKLWNRQARFNCLQTAKAFLYISTRNACVNFLQQAGYHSGVRQQISYLLRNETQEPVLTRIVRSEVLREVRSLLETLPGQCRKIMKMSYLMGLGNDEIARQLRLSIHTVRNQKARGISLLRKKLKPVALEPDEPETARGGG